MKFSELYRKLERAGWYRDQDRGAKHRIYVHDERPGVIPVGNHPSKGVPFGTLRAILKQAGLKYPCF